MSDQVVLVVDDDEDLREIMCRLLRRAGYAPVTAGCATEALAYLRHGPGDVEILLTDLGLPGVDGVGLADAARSLRPGLPILYVTGTPRAEVDRLGLVRDGAPVLTKPFTAATLTAAVRATTAASYHHTST
jgi:DNA-binding response OmpR family regulator